MVVSCFKVKLIGKKHIGNRPVLKAAKPSKKFANKFACGGSEPFRYFPPQFFYRSILPLISFP